jgi:chromosome segregation ATPase
MLFFKKKGQATDNINDSEAEKLTADTIPTVSGRGNADVDLLKAKIIAQEEYRKTIIERLNRQSEEIGELRAGLVNSQHDLEKLKVQTEKTISKVEEVKPEGLFLEVKHVDAKIETLKAKISLVDDVNTKIREELRDIRESVKGFRGLNEVLKLGEDVKVDVTTFRKIEASVNKDAAKVENIFVTLQKTLSDIQRARNSIEYIDENQKKLDKQLNELNEKIVSMARKEDLVDLKSSVNKNLVYLDKEMDKIRAIDTKVTLNISKMDQRQAQIDALQEKLASTISSSDIKKMVEIESEFKELKGKVVNTVDKDSFTDLRYMVMKDMGNLSRKFDQERRVLSRSVSTAQSYRKQTVAVARLESKLSKENDKLKREVKMLRDQLSSTGRDIKALQKIIKKNK